MGKECDHSWDLDEDRDSDAFDEIYAKWEKRDWEKWLNEKLTFPFEAKRMEDDDDAYFTDIAKSQPFRLDHVMEVIAIEMEEDLYGIIVKVREGRKAGCVPLCDLEVTSKDNPNYWPVREYVVWFANH